MRIFYYFCLFLCFLNSNSNSIHYDSFIKELNLLNIGKKADLEKYKKMRLAFFIEQEGFKTKVYTDNLNNKTVGIGFNMDAQSARNEWNGVFGHKLDFDKVYSGELEISGQDAIELFNYLMLKKESEIVKIFGEDAIAKLMPSQRMAIESLNYNSKKNDKTKQSTLIGQNTIFYQYLKFYIEEKETFYLSLASFEVSKRSNVQKYTKAGQGIQKRRLIESRLIIG